MFSVEHGGLSCLSFSPCVVIHDTKDNDKMKKVETRHSLARYTLFTVPSRIQIIHHCLLVTNTYARILRLVGVGLYGDRTMAERVQVD
jgi:hypothetical protein